MFRKYKYVLAVYEEKCFTKAAKRLFISQPSLSVAIRNIEKMLGAPLFERSGAEIKPTEIGIAYLSAAKKMQNAEAEFEKRLGDINGLQVGKLTVGGTNYISSDLLAKIVSRFRSKYPGVQITLTEANSVHLREMLLSEEADLVIDNFAPYLDLFEGFPLIDEHILLCVPKNREINKKYETFQITVQSIYDNLADIKNAPSLDISAFKDEPFILLKSGNDMLDRANAIFEGSNIKPNVVFSVDQLNISFALAQLALGSCFVTDTIFRYRKHVQDVALYKVAHPLAHRTLHLAYKKGRYCTKAMEEFIKITQQTIGE